MRAILPSLAAAAAGALALAAAARPAAAQMCHVMPPLEAHAAQPSGAGSHDGHHGHHRAHHDHHAAARPAHHVVAAVAIEGAAIEAGSYQGVAASLSWHRDRFGALATVAAYRLDAGGEVAHGLGDAVVQAHARLLGDGRTGAGVALAIGLPTGDADARLGMGHVMAMPGAWGIATRGRVVVLGAASLGAAIGDGGGDGHHDHGGGHGPLVNPMNRLELGAAVRATAFVAPALAVHALGTIARPLEDDGVTRAAAGAGARWSLGAWSLTADAQLGVAGDPFRARAVIGVDRRL